VPFTIFNWNQISEHFSSSIVLGNGASIAVDHRFAYGSLIQHAVDTGLLVHDVQQLFTFFGTNDFELVLRLVWQASNVNRSLNIPDNKTHEAYQRVRECLIQAVRNIHPEYHEVAHQLPNIYGFLKRFRTIVSLNYDLILYWTMMYGLTVNDQHSFKDCFVNGVFDDNWKRFRNPIYGDVSTSLAFYPHGSLILCRNAVETEWKINCNGNDLLNTILDVWRGEQYVPLFVSEGSVQQKIGSIQSSYYLSTIYREVLTALGPDLVIHGWGLGDQDIHLLHRINASGITRAAISVYRGDQAYCNRVWQMSRDILGPHVEVIFYDSESVGCWNQNA
jgi:hypothetical protein